MLLIDVPVIAYKTWSISCYNKTENGYVENFDAEEDLEKSDFIKQRPYSKNKPHMK